MKKTYLVVSSLVLAVASIGAQAQTSHKTQNGTHMYAPGSAYVDLSAGKSDFSLGNGIANFNSNERDNAYTVRAGSYFNQNLGLELGYTDFGNINRGGGSTKADGLSLSLSLVGKFPLSPSFNLLGKVGTTWGRTDVSANPASGIASGSEDGFGLSYGVGAEYAFNPQWSAVLQYESHDLKFAGDRNDNVAATTLGVRYKF